MLIKIKINKTENCDNVKSPKDKQKRKREELKTSREI